MTFWKSQAFKALQKDWYQRLEGSGFQDAEQEIAGEHVLKQSAAHPYQNVRHELDRTSKEAYYRLMAHLVHRTVFSNEKDRIILTMFADGAKIKDICEELTRQGWGWGISRHAIRFRIRTYEMRWGLREYTPKQLNKKIAV